LVLHLIIINNNNSWYHAKTEFKKIIVLLYIFHIILPQKQKQRVQPFCFWGEHSKGLSSLADVELDMINVLSAADITFIMSSSQAVVNWLNALDQSDFIVSLMYNKYIYNSFLFLSTDPLSSASMDLSLPCLMLTLFILAASLLNF